MTCTHCDRPATSSCDKCGRLLCTLCICPVVSGRDDSHGPADRYELCGDCADAVTPPSREEREGMALMMEGD